MSLNYIHNYLSTKIWSEAEWKEILQDSKEVTLLQTIELLIESYKYLWVFEAGLLKNFMPIQEASIYNSKKPI